MSTDACPVDAESAKSAWPSGSKSTSAPDLRSLSGASPAQEMALLLQMHQELLTMVGSLIEQNRDLMAALTDGIVDPEDQAPRSYLDGSPVR